MRNGRAIHLVAAAAILSLATWHPAQAQPASAGASAPAAEAAAQDLAKQLANPVADLVSIPLQANWEQGVGPDDGTRFVMNLQRGRRS